MDRHYDPTGHSKCKRRRLQARSPLAAHLILDEKLRGSFGELSEDLWFDLFGPIIAKDQNLRDTLDTGIRQDISYIAITPWSPLSAILGSIAWTVLPVRVRSRADEEQHSSLYLSPNTVATQSFLRVVEQTESTRHATSLQKPIEIRLQRIRPLVLDTVFVTVEKDLLQNLDEVQKRFGGGYNNAGFGPRGVSSREKAGKLGAVGEDEKMLQERLVSIVREALFKHDVIHTGDLLPLPLPSHPITHVPSPPAIVTACDPVSQGFMYPKTRIILVQARSPQDRLVKQVQSSQPVMNDVLEDTEDTSNEQFYSAAEDKIDESTFEVDGSSEDDSEERISQSHSDSEESDDSLEDMISLSAPGLPQPQSGTLSAITSATPRPGVRRGTGIQTPGSVFSNFTSMTSRPGQTIGKTFKAERLSQRISNEALHPKPNDTDDNDAFVFVDTTALARIRCFSGDWVRLETSTEPTFNEISSLNFGGLNGFLEGSVNLRPVRVFGLPGIGVTRPRYALDRSGDRRSSIPHIPQVTPSPSVFIPPILLENLGNPKFVKLSPWHTPASQSSARGNASQVQPTHSQYPPSAGEVMVLKLRTPLALDRTIDALTYSGLREHFKSKRRILKRGDLIGIPVDTEVGKATYASTAKLEDKSEDEVARAISQTADSKPKGLGVIWFWVRELSPSHSSEAVDDREDESTWDGALTCDIATTTLRTASAESGDRSREIIPLTEQGMAQWFSGESRSRASQSMVSSLTSAIPTRASSSLQKRLTDLFAAAVSPRAAAFRLPPLFTLIHSTQRQIGKSYTAKIACTMANIRPSFVDCFDLVSEGLAGGSGEYRVDETLRQRAERILDCGAESNALVLQHIETLTADRILPILQEVLSKSRVLIATATELDKIPEPIRGLFSREFELTAPDESQREAILRNAALDQRLHLSPWVDLNSVALKTAALVAGDLVDVVTRASLARSLRLEQLAADQNSRLLIDKSSSSSSSSLPITVTDILLSSYPTAPAHTILPADFSSAVSSARSAFTSSIGAPKIPSVRWSDVGGLAAVKSSIMETISLPLERPELFATGMRKRSGILFYGPPGTGKTLLAKAIATEFSLNFFSVKGPELLNMYIGESEANVRRVFQRARDARPCVVFFDELDSVAPKRGNQGDSGGVMDRIVSQLLAELDGMSSSSSSSEDSSTASSNSAVGGVFVIGATNRPDLLDPALLRPGRFDKMVYLGVSSTHEQQLTVLQALTRKFKLSPTTDLARVAEQLPFTYTGADLYALCSDAMLKAVMKKAKEVDRKVEKLSQGRRREDEMSTAWFFDHVAGPEDVEVVVEEQDFLDAKRELVASVSAQELVHFERIRRQFEAQDTTTANASAIAHSSHTQAPRPPQSPPLPLAASPSRPDVNANANNSSHPPMHMPIRPKPPLPKRSETMIPAKDMDIDMNNDQGKGKGKAVVVANPDSEPDMDEDDEDDREDEDEDEDGDGDGDYGGDDDDSEDDEDDEDDDSYIAQSPGAGAGAAPNGSVNHPHSHPRGFSTSTSTTTTTMQQISKSKPKGPRTAGAAKAKLNAKGRGKGKEKTKLRGKDKGKGKATAEESWDDGD